MVKDKQTVTYQKPETVISIFSLHELVGEHRQVGEAQSHRHTGWGGSGWDTALCFENHCNFVFKMLMIQATALFINGIRCKNCELQYILISTQSCI